MNMPGIQVFNMADLPNSGKNQQKVKKKEEKEQKKAIFSIKDLPAPHKIKAKLDDYVVGQEYAKGHGSGCLQPLQAGCNGHDG